MKYRPIGDRVLIKPTPAEDVTKGGVIIPETAKERPLRGQVVAVGPGKEDLMLIHEGDWVYYGRYAGQEITLDDIDYIVMRQDDVLLIVDTE